MRKTYPGAPAFRTGMFQDGRNGRMVDPPSRTWRNGASDVRITQGPVKAPLTLKQRRARACYGY